MNKNALQLSLISLLVQLVAVLAAVGLYWLAPGSLPSLPSGAASPAGVVGEGRLPGYEDEPVNTDPQSFYYLIGSNIVFNRPDAEGNVMIENTPGNVCDMIAVLEIEETGQVIYTSPRLGPGQHVVSDRLSATLATGTYDVVAKVDAINHETGEVLGTFSEHITVEVKNKLF